MTSRLFFIHHSCYLWEGNDAFLLFDYAGEGDVGSLLKESPNKPLYILATHSHSDHFSPSVFEEFQQHYGGCKYIFHSELKGIVGNKANTTFLNTGETYSDTFLKIKAFGSTDIGGSFFCEVQGLKMFHSGDLNNWHWNEEANDDYITQYENDWKRELRVLSKGIQYLDLLMFPTDLRLGRDYLKGLQELLAKITVKYLAPMHLNGVLDPKELEELAHKEHSVLLLPYPYISRQLL